MHFNILYNHLYIVNNNSPQWSKHREQLLATNVNMSKTIRKGLTEILVLLEALMFSQELAKGHWDHRASDTPKGTNL